MRKPVWQGPPRFRYHRPVDLLASLLSAPITLPVVLVAALVVRSTSAGPGFFRQERIGRHGRSFRILKLRTMTDTPRNAPVTRWPSVTSGNDYRVTSVGRTLRRWKIDELPQILNVIRGDMSLVGPRPDIAGFADELLGSEASVTSVRPGITGPATLLFRNEQSFLGGLDDPTHFSDTTLFAAKVVVNLAWIERGSLLDDLKLVLLTVGIGDEDRIRSMVARWAPDELKSGPVAEVLSILEVGSCGST